MGQCLKLELSPQIRKRNEQQTHSYSSTCTYATTEENTMFPNLCFSDEIPVTKRTLKIKQESSE